MLGHGPLLLPDRAAPPVDALQDDAQDVHLAFAQRPQLERLLGQAALVGLGAGHRRAQPEDDALAVRVFLLVELPLKVLGVELLQEVRGVVEGREGLEMVAREG